MHKTKAFLTFLTAVLLLTVSCPPQQILAGDSVSYPRQNTYVSPVKETPIKFTGLGVTWLEDEPGGTVADIFARFKEGNTWSDWYRLDPEIDTKNPSNQKFSAFIAVSESQAFQYKIYLQSSSQTVTPIIENPEFTYINAQEKVSAVSENLVASIGPVDETLSARINPLSAVKIVSRNMWGADEGLRLWNETRPAQILVKLPGDYYEKFAAEMKLAKIVTTDAEGKKYTWPLEYPEKVRKIIIHHTATTKNLNDPKKAIRDIYYWHAISKGWGDIGYNYIIDKDGNIYEGRYGGDSVVGAHVGGGNIGSVGIAVLGNYQDIDPSDKMVTSIVNLTQALTKKYGIDPQGHSVFRGVDQPNIMGHRDIMSTSCPGEKLYDMLAYIRTKVKGGAVPKLTDKRRVAAAKAYDYSLSVMPTAILKPGESKRLTFTLTNLGTATWGADTRLIVSSDETASRMLPSTKMIESLPSGQTVAPGSTATFNLDLVAGYESGMAIIQLFPFVDGSVKVEKYINLPIQIESMELDYEIVSVDLAKSSLAKGEKTTAKVEIKNLSNVTWKRDGVNSVHLGTQMPQDRISSILIRPGTRLGVLVEREVKPGEVGHFLINIKAPNQDKVIREYFAPVIENISWLPFKNNYLEIKVGTPPVAVASTSASTQAGLINKQIKVGIGFTGMPIISADGAFKLLENGKELGQFAKDEKVSITYANGKFTVKGFSKEYTSGVPPRFEPVNGTILRIDNYEHRPAWNTSYNDNEYRGALIVVWYENRLQVVNDLSVENYLRGLAEISATDPVEKIRAIIILARSYAFYYTTLAEKFPGAPYNLTDDPERSQKYLGYGFEKRNPTGVKAVIDTRAIYVTYNGKIIKTPYFTSDDGRTRSAQEVWGWTDTPYLVSVDDPGCKGNTMQGHGVGMSGCGSYYLAKKGKTYTEIIQYYFKGVEIKK